MQKIYGTPLPSPEEPHEVIKDIQKTVQGILTQGYELEGLAQANAVLTRLKSSVITQLAQMTVIMNAMQEQLKTLASVQTNQVRPKIKYYCWSCGSNFTHGIITCSEKKAGHQEEVYYKKMMGGSEKGRE